METLLECTAVHKTYEGTVHALKGVSLRINKGRVHAIIGENGAGKSTLAKILGGLVGYDAGTITLKGQEYKPASPRDADAHGIGMVHQHFMLFPSLTVAENIILGQEPTARGQVDMKRAVKDVRELSERYGMPLEPRRCVEEMSVGEQQRVEILKTLYRDVELVIFDEPTAVLTPQEVEKLFKGIRRLIAEKYTVIIIAHKLEEVLAIADDITILRRGEVVGSRRAEGASREGLVRLMVGNDIALDKERGFGTSRGDVLTLTRVSLRGDDGRQHLNDITLNVQAGEILGIAGVEGNGQTELEQLLGGLCTPSQGSVVLAGRDVTSASPRERRNMGLVYIPSDRMAWGCSPQASVFENSISQAYPRFTRAGFIRRGTLFTEVQAMFDRFDVRSPGMAAPLGSLSGGNIQKLILGRELTTAGHDGGPNAPIALVVAKPTRGIDIRGVEFIHDLLACYRDAGCAILLISTDLDEIIALSDRIAVLYEGSVAAVLPGRGQTRRDELGKVMLQGAPALGEGARVLAKRSSGETAGAARGHEHRLTTGGNGADGSAGR